MNRLALFLCCLSPFLASAQVDTDIYLVDLSVKGNTVVLSNPRNITPHKGYDNQPFSTLRCRCSTTRPVRTAAAPT